MAYSRDDNAKHGKMQETWRGKLEREVEKTAKAGGHNTRGMLVRRDLANWKAGRGKK